MKIARKRYQGDRNRRERDKNSQRAIQIALGGPIAPKAFGIAKKDQKGLRVTRSDVRRGLMSQKRMRDDPKDRRGEGGTP
jgi:hypothetical protein